MNASYKGSDSLRPSKHTPRGGVKPRIALRLVTSGVVVARSGTIRQPVRRPTDDPTLIARIRDVSVVALEGDKVSKQDHSP